jgi:formate--tetrahydrofolate ligase
MGLAKIGERACLALREPSLGPALGMKGGATGGGHSLVLPMQDINLHFTGDIHAVGSAHNLLAAMVDNHIYRRLEPMLDPRRVRWGRVLDVNDRELRDIVVGLGAPTDGVPHESFFDITAASEVMAILCLAEDLADLKRRLGNVLVGFTYKREPVYARDLGAAGAMTALLRDALQPNLVQTIEGTPAFVHGGPFANIAHGCNSVLATRMALAFADWGVTEAGFGFDLGAEKFFDIKCISGRFCPSLVVLVATCRALKMHGGVSKKELTGPNPEAVAQGLPNLEKHLENIGKFGLPAVVCLNRFLSDTEEELKVVLDRCRELGVPAAVGDGFAQGGDGMRELAELVRENARDCTGDFKPLYDWGWPIEKKIYTVAHEVYGAEHVDYTSKARHDLKTIEKFGYAGLPVCIAKTQNSLSDNPKLLGRPKDFVVTVREIQIAAGAGFVVPLTGNILRMPGLPKDPAAAHMDIDLDGNITGLF